ncbi:MAG: PHB depolymerase family esterase [Verrucomicrobiota bacterium]
MNKLTTLIRKSGTQTEVNLMKSLIHATLCAAALTIANASEIALTPDSTHESLTADGRKIIRFSHPIPVGSEGDGVTSQYFFVTLPKTDTAPLRPLIVYLHSAGGHAESGADVARGQGFLSTAGPEFMLLEPNCASTDGPGGWWGWRQAEKNGAPGKALETPVEQRVLATIEWVVQKYNVDRNRIYLCGISMGGCGSLGIGMHHGDIFAAINVHVPAGAGFGMLRMQFPDPVPSTATSDEKEIYLRKVSGAGLPDAPPIVDFSSSDDGWSGDQPRLFQAAHDGRHALVLGWGPHGHEGFQAVTDPLNYAESWRATLEYPWLSIRKNEAYPVFTDASSDKRWKVAPETYGQINAFTRWKNIKDTPGEFGIQLRLVESSELSAQAFIPAQVVADVTPRRLQQFKVVAKSEYAWTYKSDNVSLAGTLKPDAANLLTFPQLPITRLPALLSIKSVP